MYAWDLQRCEWLGYVLAVRMRQVLERDGSHVDGHMPRVRGWQVRTRHRQRQPVSLRAVCDGQILTAPWAMLGYVRELRCGHVPEFNGK